MEQPPEGLEALEKQAQDRKVKLFRRYLSILGLIFITSQASSFTVLPPIPELSMFKLGPLVPTPTQPSFDMFYL